MKQIFAGMAEWVKYTFQSSEVSNPFVNVVYIIILDNTM